MAARPDARPGESPALDGRDGGERAGRITGERAALRRVATLVAQGAPPGEVFAAVAAEVGRVLEAAFTYLNQYGPDGAATVRAAWARTGMPTPVRVGDRLELGGRNVTTLVFQTRRPARIGDYVTGSGPAADVARGSGIRSAVGVPVSVEGRLWGAMIVASTREEPLPDGTEARLAGFTELAATAIANAQARVELRGYADEQAALRRVATLVARAAAPDEVFAAVTAEVGRGLEVGFTVLSRYDPDGAATVLATWAKPGAVPPVPVGERFELEGRNLHALVFQSHRPSRIDEYANVSGSAAAAAIAAGMTSGVGAPISVAGRLWGVMIVNSTRAEPLPDGTEARLAGFTELAATAIANAQARLELRGYADEQAALRRVATLVARAAPPGKVFAAVTEEVRRLLAVDFTHLSRYDPDGAATVLAAGAKTGTPYYVHAGDRLELGGHNVITLVFQTQRSSRIDDYAEASGPVADVARRSGLRSAVGVPVSVDGRLWGAMIVASPRAEPLPAGTEARLAGFTELAGTAIANAEAQSALTASRARIVATADAARRRIERNLHDGAQQRLLSLALQLRAVQAAPPGAAELSRQLDGAVTEVNDVLEELREIARGLHPAILADGGLRPALKTLARRSAVPIRLEVSVAGRLPEPVEIAAYYAVSEALANTAKHARASVIDVHVKTGDGALHVRVRDDGRGGADFGHGSGLVGLQDRIEALGGRLSLHSPPGAGTTVHITLPLGDP